MSEFKSLQESITLESVLDEIRLHAYHPQNRDRVFFLVEGDSDIRLFRKLFNQNICKVKSIPGGVSKLEQGLSKLYLELNRIIGIRDADFMNLEEKTPSISVLFLTDTHDIETLMIKSDEAFISVVHEFYNYEFSVSELRNTFLNSISYFGYLRWYNDLNNLELNFKDVGIGDFFDAQNLKLDKLKCIQNIVNRSPNCKCDDVEIILQKVDKLIKSEHDLFQVCNGHDVANAMAIFFNFHKSGLKGLTGERIQSSLRLVYNINQFQNTDLFIKINIWALANSYNLF
jgi:hypothetical protein